MRKYTHIQKGSHKERRLIFRRGGINRFQHCENNEYHRRGPRVSREDFEKRRKNLVDRKDALIKKMDDILRKTSNNAEWQNYKQGFVNKFNYWNTQYDRIANGHRSVFQNELTKVVSGYEKAMRAVKAPGTQQRKPKETVTQPSGGLEKINNHTWTLHVPAGSNLSLKLGGYAWQSFGQNTVNMGNYSYNGFRISRDRSNRNKIWIQSATPFSYAINGTLKGSSGKAETVRRTEQKKRTEKKEVQRSQKEIEKQKVAEAKKHPNEWVKIPSGAPGYTYMYSESDLFGDWLLAKDGKGNTYILDKSTYKWELKEKQEHDLNYLFGGDDLFGGGEQAGGGEVDLNDLFGKGTDKTEGNKQETDVKEVTEEEKREEELRRQKELDDLFGGDQEVKKSDNSDDILDDLFGGGNEDIFGFESNGSAGESTGKRAEREEEFDDLFGGTSDKQVRRQDTDYNDDLFGDQKVDTENQGQTEDSDGNTVEEDLSSNNDDITKQDTEEDLNDLFGGGTEDLDIEVDTNQTENIGGPRRRADDENYNFLEDLFGKQLTAEERQREAERKIQQENEAKVVEQKREREQKFREQELLKEIFADEETEVRKQETEQETEVEDLFGKREVEVESDSENNSETSGGRTEVAEDLEDIFGDQETTGEVRRNVRSNDEGPETNVEVDLEEIRRQQEEQRKRDINLMIKRDAINTQNRWTTSNFGEVGYKYCYLETGHNGYTGNSQLFAWPEGSKFLHAYDSVSNTWRLTSWKDGVPPPEGMQVVNGELKELDPRLVLHQKKIQEALRFRGQWKTIESGTPGYLYNYVIGKGLYAFNLQNGGLFHNTEGTTFEEVRLTSDIPPPPREFMLGKTGPVLRLGTERIGTPEDERLSGHAYVEKVKEIIKTRGHYIQFEETFIDPHQPDRRFGITDSMEGEIRAHGKEVMGIGQKERSIERRYGITIETEVTTAHGSSKARCERFGLRYIETQLTDLEAQLGHYPKEIFSYLKKGNAPLHILLFNNWSSEYNGRRFNAGGFSFGSGKVGVKDIKWALDHEMLHALDYVDGGMNDDNSKWGESAHGELYAGLYGKHGGEAILAGTANGTRPEGFADRYGKTGGINEDQATIAQEMLTTPEQYRTMKRWARREPALARKMTMTKQYYKKWSNGKMDDTFWRDWEFADRPGRKIDRAYWARKNS